MANPPLTSVAVRPAPATTTAAAAEDRQRLSYVDVFGNPSPRERARFAVLREFDDSGKLISLMTQVIKA